MPTPESPPDPPAGEAWWLCSHLVSVSVLETNAAAPVAVLEEISPGGMRLALDERIPEGATLQVVSGSFKVSVTVVECRVRTDDFLLETRFEGDFRWSPDLWTPDHLYQPPVGRTKSAETS